MLDKMISTQVFEQPKLGKLFYEQGKIEQAKRDKVGENLNSTQEATFSTSSPCAKKPSPAISSTLLVGTVSPYPIWAFMDFSFINCASATLEVSRTINTVRIFLIICFYNCGDQVVTLKS